MDINHQVMNRYGFEAAEVEQISKGSTNTQFAVNTRNGKWLLRRYSKPQESDWNRMIRTKETIIYEHHVLQYASDHGIPCVPPLNNKEGSTLTKIGDDFYAVFPFIVSADFSPPLSEKGVKAAKLLAEYHEVMENYTITYQRPSWGYAGKLAEWFHENEVGIGNVEEILDWARKLKPENETFDFLRQNAAYIDDLVKMLAEDFPEDAYHKYPVVVNHGDYISKNIGVRGDSLVLFDFDFCVRDLRIYDLSILIAYTAGEEHTGKNMNMQVVQNIVQAYRKFSYMSAEELCLTPYMVIAFRLHILLGNLGILKSTLQYRLDLLQRNLDGIRWLMEHRQDIREALMRI